MTEKRCTYYNPSLGRRCSGEARYQLTFGGREHPLCEEHTKEKYHPPDLADKIWPLMTEGSVP